MTAPDQYGNPHELVDATSSSQTLNVTGEPVFVFAYAEACTAN
jgi:hypothetical protein